MNKLDIFNKKQLKDVTAPKIGDNINVYQKIKEGEKERIQIFRGVVIAKKHGKNISATLTVRGVAAGIGVEKTFPLYSPNINKIEVLSRSKVRRAKLYYLRKAVGKKSKMKKLEE